MVESYLQKIKRLGIIAMFSDDELMDQLVLKGGNMLDIVYSLSTRPSADLDFSIDGDFVDQSAAEIRIRQTIQKTFAAEGLVAFDIEFRSVPPKLTVDRADFWGGYKVEFKIIEQEKYKTCMDDLEKMRRAALTIGKAKSGSAASTKFGIDLSRHEYCEGKERIIIDGYTIFVYSPPMFVCEKIRAICQQMPIYAKRVGSHPSGRARDFFDIYTATQHFNIDFADASYQSLVRNIFGVKRVPLKLIGQIVEQREFHRDSFQAVQDTIKAGVVLEEYDFYFEYVLERCECLKVLWDE